jgi:hypothetical protein
VRGVSAAIRLGINGSATPALKKSRLSMCMS